MEVPLTSTDPHKDVQCLIPQNECPADFGQAKLEWQHCASGIQSIRHLLVSEILPPLSFIVRTPLIFWPER
ncbi:hypothetical protein MUK42_13563 [Musa troglodytarum]|uniref:Uncharacterized protein n=1 Tax=Musa troglodytarum TaxID=320322 RepID=A0A9E7I9V2_9LILI|nr:hypothetical protein MUK42_13563 [Musa troglodytarum]